MAIAVPLLMGAMGASATAIALTSVAFAVTGISEKINNAAASVFGKDLTMIGNIFGAAYGMATGFGIGGAESAITAGEAPLEGMAGVAGSAAPAAADSFNLADMSGGMTPDAADSMASYNSPEQMAGDADAIRSMGGDAQGPTLSTTAPAEMSPADLANATQKPADLIQPANSSNAIQAQGAAAPGASTASAAGQTAAAPNATATTATAPNAAAPVANAAATNATAPRSFFDKLLYDKSGNINPTTLRVGGSILAGYGKSAQEQKMLDQRIAEERRRMSQSTGLRVTQ